MQGALAARHLTWSLHSVKYTFFAVKYTFFAVKYTVKRPAFLTWIVWDLTGRARTGVANSVRYSLLA
jgi:hypothetical protein